MSFRSSGTCSGATCRSSGPRPERPVFVHQFRGEIPHYMLRHKVKAGITGWAQVNGWRGNTSLDRRIECDLYYIRNWSYCAGLEDPGPDALEGLHQQECVLSDT